VRTNESHTSLVKLSVIREKKRRALSPYGPVKAGLTTSVSQRTLSENQLRQLSELLNSLESVVESLNYKSFTAYDTLVTATEGVRVALSNIATDVDGTDKI
jgi:hypothetical protein